MKYTVSLDKLAKGVTIGVTILFAVIIAMQFFITTSKGHIPVYICVLVPLIYFFIYAIRPFAYEVDNGQLIIRRMLKDIVISQRDIKTAAIVEPEKLRGSIRLFGVGGLFGYFGIFSNSQLGRMTWYATRRDKIVLLVTHNDKKIILTPDDPTAFVASLEKLI